MKINKSLYTAPLNTGNVCIRRSTRYCYMCKNCKSTCNRQMTVLGYYDDSDDNVLCINCGQCVVNCPAFAMTDVSSKHEIFSAIKDPAKIVVASISPAVRTSLGDAFGMEEGTYVLGKAVTLLKNYGFDYVVDTALAADLTVVEEGEEFISRLNNGTSFTQYTSCCPSWVKFAEYFYPQIVSNISKCKSPIGMQGPMIKLWLSHQNNIPIENIVNVAITPCTAKKEEILLPDGKSTGVQDMDYVLTVRELAEIARMDRISLPELPDTPLDNIVGEPSTDGIHFGASGGVAKAVLNYVYSRMTGKIEAAPITVEPVEGIETAKALSTEINGDIIKAAVIWGTANIRKFVDANMDSNYQLVEVMACPGGCIGGGGQYKGLLIRGSGISHQRFESQFAIEQKEIFSSMSDSVKNAYNILFEAPGSSVARKYLHKK